MSITRQNPNTVFLGGDRTQINDLAASEAITPGHLVERFVSAGVTRWRKSTGNGTAKAPAVHTDMSMQNKGVDDACAANDLIEVSVLHKGATAWMFIASGTTANFGDLLGDNGSASAGTLKTSPTVALFTALESKSATVTPTRIRVEAL